MVSKPLALLLHPYSKATSTALLSVILFLYYKQTKFIYSPSQQGHRHPHRNPKNFRHPSERGLKCEEVYITTEDKVKLHGWMLLQENPKEHVTVVVFHGIGGNLGNNKLIFIEDLYRRSNVNVLAMAYRGYSYSEGSPSEIGIQEDVKAIIRYIFEREDIDREKIIIHGKSFGGGAAIYGVSTLYDKPIKGLILENTFTSLKDVILHKYYYLKLLFKLIVTERWPSLERISKIKIPILMYSGLADKLIPPSHMDQLFTNATSAPFKEIVQVPGGNHSETWSLDKDNYFAKLNEFIQKCCSSKGIEGK